MWSPIRRHNTTKESFSRHGASKESFSKHRAGKSSSFKKPKSFRAQVTSSRRFEIATQLPRTPQQNQTSPALASPIVTLSVGPEQRLFAAHEDILLNSPVLGSLCAAQFYETNKRIDLHDEQPETLSCILEFLYKGDYYPRLAYDKRRQSWSLENERENAPVSNSNLPDTVSIGNVIQVPIFSLDSNQQQQMTFGKILRDTAVYCAAAKYGLAQLQNLALKKQGLQSGVSCATILTSARYAYTNTPDSDSRLRAHYLALIVRSRATFKRSGTMQAEMELGGSKMFFDLFVAMANHMDDLTDKK